MRRNPVGAALIGAVCISFSAIWVRLAESSPLTVGLYRFVYALPVLVLLARVRSEPPQEFKVRATAFAAGVFLALDVVFWHEAIAVIGAGLGTLAVNSQVVIVPLATWAVFGERPSARSGYAMPLVVMGLVLITGLGDDEAYGSDPARGVALAALAAVFYAAFLVAYRRAGRTLGSPVGSLLDLTIGAAAGSLLIGAFTADIAFAPVWPAHGWILALAFGTQVLGWLFIGHALPRLEAAQTSVIILLQPTLTLVWGRLLFDESASALQFAGAALVLGGILVATLPTVRGRVSAA